MVVYINTQHTPQFITLTRILHLVLWEKIKIHIHTLNGTADLHFQPDCPIIYFSPFYLLLSLDVALLLSLRITRLFLQITLPRTCNAQNITGYPDVSGYTTSYSWHVRGIKRGNLFKRTTPSPLPSGIQIKVDCRIIFRWAPWIL